MITELTHNYCSVVILDDLDKLKEDNNKKDKRFNKRLGLWLYRRIQFCIEYEAKERNLKVVKINPRRPLQKCPRCSKLVEMSIEH